MSEGSRVARENRAASIRSCLGQVCGAQTWRVAAVSDKRHLPTQGFSPSFPSDMGQIFYLTQAIARNDSARQGTPARTTVHQTSRAWDKGSWPRMPRQPSTSARIKLANKQSQPRGSAPNPVYLAYREPFLVEEHGAIAKRVMAEALPWRQAAKNALPWREAARNEPSRDPGGSRVTGFAQDRKVSVTSHLLPARRGRTTGPAAASLVPGPSDHGPY